MTLERALKVVPHDAVVTATCTTNRYGGAWMVTADDRPLTQFVEPWSAARYVNGWYAAVGS